MRTARRRTWPVRAVEGLALVGWAGLAFAVVRLSPDEPLGRLVFFASLGLALWTTFGLTAYGLSFVLFADERYRGNLGRSLWQGAITGAVGLAAALLQLDRALSPAAGVVLATLFLIGQIAALLRKCGDVPYRGERDDE